jgi:hypothetical protein
MYQEHVCGSLEIGTGNMQECVIEHWQLPVGIHIILGVTPRPQLYWVCDLGVLRRGIVQDIYKRTKRNLWQPTGTPYQLFEPRKF